MTTLTVRIVCPHCRAVLEGDASTESMSMRCAACEEVFDARAENGTTKNGSLNQSAPHETVMSEVLVGASLDQVFLPAVTHLREHVWVLLLTSLIVNLIWFAVIGFPLDALADSWSQLLRGDAAGDGRLLAVTLGGTVLLGLLIATVSAYTISVMIRLSLRIVRYDALERDTALLRRVGAALNVPFMRVLRLALLLIAVGMVGVFFWGIGLVAIVVLSLYVAPQTATLVGVVGVGIVSVGVFFLLQWLLWPVVFFIADGRTDLITGLSWGVRLAWRHRKLTLSLVTVYFVLATVGSMLFYVGQMVTTPLAMVPMAIGYRKMTGGGEFERDAGSDCDD